MPKKRFYTLSFTWGLPLTLVGVVVGLFLRLMGVKPTRFGPCLCFGVRGDWGLNLGPVILCAKDADDDLKSHEFGHAIQNTRFGPLMLILVLCSAARFHDRDRRARRGESLPPYDSWWFEGQATRLGAKYIVD